MTGTPFPITPSLVAVAVAYRNAALIADLVSPRVPTQGAQEFRYRKYALADAFTLPDTHVGRRSQPNEVEFGFEEVTGSTQDYGLDDPIPQADIDNGRSQGHDPRNRATMLLTDLIMLAREKRTADLVFAAGNYGANNKVTLAGNDQWSAFAQAASNPIDDITAGLDACIMRPNIAVMGQAVWTKLSQHPVICKAVNRNDGDAGIASRRAVADLFELEDIYVGQGWVNTAKKGQAPTMARVWGKSCALLVRNQATGLMDGPASFTVTAQWGGRIAGSERDSKIGLRGGERVRAGESVKELVMANDFGYLISDAVA